MTVEYHLKVNLLFQTNTLDLFSKRVAMLGTLVGNDGGINPSPHNATF